MRPTAVDLLEVETARGQIATAAEVQNLEVVAQGKNILLPGYVLVVEGLDVPLLSFHAMEAGGYEYSRHPTEDRLREWKRNGKVISELTFCVYSNNVALWHRLGAEHVYPVEFPTNMGAYRTVDLPEQQEKEVRFAETTTIISEPKNTATTRWARRLSSA